ncbi:GNAT family N-acetyltransferase [Corynebacterium lubricantis]|uniref:GNAT family N-acetyltransferase n=1 Tax=Corynebacterium lubricantis TaxID=541095 RepID=UPI0003668808|nr:GNAT family N-acetyltransferase [Corynebacterium lubricantis]
MTNLISAVRLIDLSALEVHQLYKLRVDVFVHEQKTPYAEIDDADAEQDTWHIIAKKNNKIVGYARIYPHGSDTGFGRFVIHPDERGTGLGPEVFRAAMERARKEWPERDVVLDAQETFQDFYTERGFKPDGELYDDTGVPHQPMRLTAAELAYYLSTPEQ